MTRVVYNSTYGGFSLSDDARSLLGITRIDRDIDRTNIHLINLIDRLGSAMCSGPAARLAVFSVPDEWRERWKIDEYDGEEQIIFDEAKWLEGRLKDIYDVFPEPRELIAKIIQDYHRIRDM